MKTYKNLYPRIYAWDTLEAAYRRARTPRQRILSTIGSFMSFRPKGGIPPMAHLSAERWGVAVLSPEN